MLLRFYQVVPLIASYNLLGKRSSYEEALRVWECLVVKSGFECCFGRLGLWLFC